MLFKFLFVLLYIFIGVLVGKIIYELGKNKDFLWKDFDKYDDDTGIIFTVMSAIVFPVAIPLLITVKLSIRLTNLIIKKL